MSDPEQPHVCAIPQPTPLWLHFEHLGRTYRIIGWEHHNDTWCPIILNLHGPKLGLGNALHNLGSGTWPVSYTDTPPTNPGLI